MPAHRTREPHSLQSVALEVKTDAPTPPSLSIISPTPRAFTFPLNIQDATPRAFSFPAHLTDSSIGESSPISPTTPSPCTSPFEPDLTALAISQRTQSPRPLKPLPPVDAPASSSAPSASHRRRGSACSSTERKPKKGDEDYIKRPENAFILFRRECCLQKNAAEAAGANDSPSQRRQRQADLSKTISQQWKSLPADERAYWDELAKQRKKEHEEMYPWYVYQPTRTKEKSRKSTSKSKSRKGKSSVADSDDFEIADTDESESVSYVLPNGRRASSAPTPPPAHFPGIRLPTLLTPSCPNSPSPYAPTRSHSHGRLLAPPDLSTHFNFLPHDPLNSLQFAQISMDASGQVPDFTSNIHSSNMFANVFETSEAPMGDRSNMRTFPAITIPATPPRNSIHLQHISPTPSVASSSSGPSTPHRIPYGYQTQYAPAVQSPNTVSPQPAAVELPASPKHVNNTVGDWDSFGLPSWAMPTLWPNMDSNFSMLGDGDMDVSSIPPLSLELPHHQQHDGDLDGSDGMADPLFGLQFRFEDLLDPSQL